MTNSADRVVILAATAAWANATAVDDRKKDERGNYTYDDLNRLIKSKDALNYETQYYYDAAGKLTEQKNPKGVSTYNEYDLLGQLIWVKALAAGGSIATTRYIYDNAGNKIKEITPNDYDPAKDTAALAATLLYRGYNAR